MGGDNSGDNLVYLTAREHFVAHQLLVKMHPGNRKLVYALQAMLRCGPGQQRSNRRYEWIRLAISEAKKGQSSWNKGKTLSKEHCENLRKSHLGKRNDNESYQKGIETKIANGHNFSFNKGKKHTQAWKDHMSVIMSQPRKPMSEQAKANMSNTARNRTEFSCIACKDVFKHARHFSACKG